MGFGIHQSIATSRCRRRLKKDTDASWQAKLDDRAEHLHARCTYHCGALLETTRKRDILLQLVEAYAQAKRERNMAEFSDFTIAAYQLIERFPSIGERTRRRYSHVLHHAGRSAGSTVPRGCVTEVRRQRGG